MPLPTSPPSDAEAEQTFRSLFGDTVLYEHYCAKVDEHTTSPLTRWERLAILAYTKTFADYYWRLNQALRSGPLDTDSRIFGALMAQGLQKLPRHDGLVTRGIRVPSVELQPLVHRHRKDATIEWKAFSNCSAQGGLGITGNVFFIVRSKNGRTLGPYADDEREREVNFLPLSTFVVEAAELRYDRAIISMSECEPLGETVREVGR